MRALIVITIVALTGLSLAAGSIPTAKPEEVGLSTDRLKRIGEAVQRHIDEGSVAGAVTLIARKGRIAHFEARGMMDLVTIYQMSRRAAAGESGRVERVFLWRRRSDEHG